MPEIALIGQYSENNFNGCNCGIMDQFASAMGKKDNAIFLDTSDSGTTNMHQLYSQMQKSLSQTVK